MNRLQTVLFPLMLALCHAEAPAAIRIARSGVSYPSMVAAAYAASDGDIVEIDSGTYLATSACAAFYANNLTIRGVGPTRPKLYATGMSAESKGIFVMHGNSCTIENLEFYDCAVSSDNGAGIRFDGRGGTVRNCYFYNNEMGILTGNWGDDNYTIEFCEFDYNGYTGPDQHWGHNVYIGVSNSVTFRYCWSHNAKRGHEFKTRAKNNYVLYNRIMNQDGPGSMEVDIPVAGTSYVIGNLIENGPNSANTTMLSYGEEGATNPDQHLYVVNNTFVNDSGGSGLGVYNATGTPALVQNNIFQKIGTVLSGSGTKSTNWSITNASLLSSVTYDYHLTATSTGAINAGTAPGTGITGFSLLPTLQYRHPCSYEGRPSSGTISIGAYELGTANQRPVVDAGTDQVVNANAATLTGAATDDGLPNPPAAVTCSWTLLSAPPCGTATLVSPGSLTTAVTFSTTGIYRFQLQASDGVFSASNTVTVQYNRSPTASAGADQTIALPAGAMLSGLATDDGLPDPPAALSYTWTMLSGPGSVTFANPYAATTTATFSAPGIYVLQLTASDGAAASASTVTITVKPPPTAKISPLPALLYEYWPLTLTCSASDPNGYTLAYTWTQTGGAPVTLTGGATSRVSFTTPLVGTIRDGTISLKVTVSNSRGGSASDTVRLFVYMTGDIDHDYNVTLADMKLLIAAWNSTPTSGNWNVAADLDNSDSVILADLKILVANWNRAMLP